MGLSADWTKRAPYDHAVIDGPHHDVSRDGALPECFGRLRVGGWAIVDDCRSGHMQQTLRRWNQLFGPSIAWPSFPSLRHGSWGSGCESRGASGAFASSG